MRRNVAALIMFVALFCLPLTSQEAQEELTLEQCINTALKQNPLMLKGDEIVSAVRGLGSRSAVSSTCRAAGGSFMRIVHVPTGISRMQMPPLGDAARQQAIKDRFLQEIENELKEKGMTQYIE